jgi:16S rRNA processing protein RimM
MDDLVAIAKVARPRGIKGEVVADLLTDFPERFDGLTQVIGLSPDGARQDLKIESSRLQNGRILLKFAGIETIEDAEAIRDAEICVTEDEAVELEEDEYFDWELEGCRVQTLAGEMVGTVKELMRTGGTENLVVQGTEKDHLIPFAEAICVDVDIENKLIKIDPPEGLLEF